MIDGRLGPSRRQQVALLGVLLEVVGADTVIAVTGPWIWREALADLANRADDGGSWAMAAAVPKVRQSEGEAPHATRANGPLPQHDGTPRAR